MELILQQSPVNDSAMDNNPSKKPITDFFASTAKQNSPSAPIKPVADLKNDADENVSESSGPPI